MEVDTSWNKTQKKETLTEENCFQLNSASNVLDMLFDIIKFFLRKITRTTTHTKKPKPFVEKLFLSLPVNILDMYCVLAQAVNKAYFFLRFKFSGFLSLFN